MNFSEALTELKSGHDLTRTGWNGKHNISLQEPDEESKMTLPYIYMEVDPKEDGVEFPKIPWVASQADILATDWEVEEIS